MQVVKDLRQYFHMLQSIKTLSIFYNIGFYFCLQFCYILKYFLLFLSLFYFFINYLIFAHSKLGGRTKCFPLSKIINLPNSSGKMQALRPVHGAKFFPSIYKIPAVKCGLSGLFMPLNFFLQFTKFQQ